MLLPSTTQPHLLLLLLLLLLHLSISSTSGFPSYGSDAEDYYDDYNDEEYADEGDDVDQEDLEEMGKMAKMNTNGETFKVDAGTTIRMPCNIQNLPESYQSSVIWSKLDQKNTQISIGDTIVPEDYQRRAKVTATEQGLELTIAAARAGDAGRYKCSLTVGDTRQTLVQTVHIRGGALQESSSAKQLVVSEGDQMTLSCLTSSQAGDNPSVSWSKQAGRLPGGQERAEGAVLQVEDVRLEDGGLYICTASDSQHGAVQKTVQVTVVLPSSPEPNSSSKLVCSLLSILLAVQSLLYLL